MSHRKRELEQMLEQIEELQERARCFNAEGVNVDQVTAALNQLSSEVDALIASKAAPTGITPAEAQTIVDGLNAIGAKVKAATPAA